jgi:hypothetical protein
MRKSSRRELHWKTLVAYVAKLYRIAYGIGFRIGLARIEPPTQQAFGTSYRNGDSLAKSKENANRADIDNNILEIKASASASDDFVRLLERSLSFKLDVGTSDLQKSS